MNCPHCQVALVQKTIQEQHYALVLDCCPQCHGLWLDRKKRAILEQIVEPVVLEVRKIPVAIDQMIGLYCPACPKKVLLSKVDHPRDEHVVVDICPNCEGIWLDQGELTAIQQENIFLSFWHLLRDLYRGGRGV